MNAKTQVQANKGPYTNGLTVFKFKFKKYLSTFLNQSEPV